MASRHRNLCLSVKIQFLLRLNINYGMGSDFLDMKIQISASGLGGGRGGDWVKNCKEKLIFTALLIISDLSCVH